MRCTPFALLALLFAAEPAMAAAAAKPVNANRLTYLDGNDPYYVSRDFPKLITPQWVGEEGVDAVVVLAIDDMRDPAPYETFLRPALDRLKKIDGRAPVSIMTCKVDPADPRLQAWLKEGLSIEVHTVDHPCPILTGADLPKAKSTYDRCVDLMGQMPGNKPVAFRTPCCDSLNTPSPRLFAEVFNKTTPNGNFLAIDSSVFNITTADDPALPRELVFDPEGTERFRKYVPFKSFVNTIEDYPYPYVIGRLCWQFPCMVPSDWEAQNILKPGNPKLLEDWKAALDVTVVKKGTFNVVFHPYGWSTPEQVAEFVDYADKTYGKRVKFLNFRECLERLNKHLLGGQAIRADDGGDNGVRVLDLNDDGYLDVVIGNERVKQTRLWSPAKNAWEVSEFPVDVIGARFGVVHDGVVSVIVRNESASSAWTFAGSKWQREGHLVNGLGTEANPVLSSAGGRDRGVRLRDVDGDGRCELIVANDAQRGVFGWETIEKQTWSDLPFNLPPGAAFVDAEGRDAGLRFFDIDEDGRGDVVFSNEREFGLYLFDTTRDGWSRKVLAGKPGDEHTLPMISRDGTDNGAWFHSRHLWVQNENTAALPDLVDRRAFNFLLRDDPPRAKSPEASLRSIRVRPGFTVELVAAEPLTMDPIAFEWGPDGKLWVVEMADYPMGIDNQGTPGGRVRYLEDVDGDGVYDKSTLFLDGVPYPTGVMPWRKGVLVTAAPYVFYAEDADGDGAADERRSLFVGFGEGNQQHRLNGFAWGLDNWVYGANGDSGGTVRSVRTGEEVDISGRDWRIKPDQGLIQAVYGQTQFGRSRDDWGNWFGCNNSNPMYHFVLDDWYVGRNPHLPTPSARVDVPGKGSTSQIYPISRTLPRFNDGFAENRFTSANSVVVYRDDLFGPHFSNSSFVTDPVHNVVHREVMGAHGTTFKSRVAEDERESEFLASSDNWSRFITVKTGPDGALYVADMYRETIEHPEWIPDEWEARLDVRAGHDKGRIYRVYPVGATPRKIPRFGRLSSDELVGMLDSPNGWQRDTAHRLLVERRNKDSVKPLKAAAAEMRRPQARLHALCALDGMGALEPALTAAALADDHPGVRRHAVRLCDPVVDEPASDLVGKLAKMADTETDPQVRLQLAYTLGESKDPRAGAALGRMALKDADDPYIRAAVMSSVNKDNLDAILLAVLSGDRPPPPALLEILLRLGNALDNEKATATLLNAIATPRDGTYTAEQMSALAGLLDALGDGGTTLAAMAEEADDNLKPALAKLSGLFDHARKVAAKPDAPDGERAAAVRLLGRGLDKQREDVAALSALLVPQSPDAVQSAAVEALGRASGADAPKLLLAGWKGHGPAVRAQVLDVLLSRDEWTAAALDAIESKKVLPADVDAARRQRLVGHADAAVKDRAFKLFSDVVNPDRQKVIQAFQPALSLEGKPAHGAELFVKTCAACHQLAGVGNAVGPNLAALTDKSPENLLIHVLDPNRAVEANFINYVLQTKDGRTLTGMIASETGNGVTLVGVDGKPVQVLRTDIKVLRSQGISMMPENLEAGMQPQDLADLLAHVRVATGAFQAGAPARKTFSGNNPRLVKPAADGSLVLTPADCEIYGSNLMLEDKHRNLGWWRAEDDRAVWTVEVPAEMAGRYRMILDYACDNAVAGNTYLVEVAGAGASRMTGKVEGTGTWDDYRKAEVGQLSLFGGRQRITFRPAGPIDGAMIDLKSVTLVPRGGK